MKTIDGHEADPATIEICTRCGMVANLDPWTHTERYGHAPEVVRDGIAFRFNSSGRFVPDEFGDWPNESLARRRAR